MEDINEIVRKMTLEEKASLCVGCGAWHTHAVKRLGVPQIAVSDGPHGLRKQEEKKDFKGKTIQSVCFPTGSALACSWDVDLLNTVGGLLGDECRAEDVQIILGPAVNIKRSPLCGRNFEYYSEDPFLATNLATAFIKGVQAKGVGTSIKHFAANNKETHRLSTDTIVSERALHEIYLAAFEGAVKNAQPWTVMAAYNKINGRHCAEDRWLLTDVLRKQWGFEGFVMSDWGAVSDRPMGIKAGLDLEMPASNGSGEKEIVKAVKSGRLTMSALDKCVKRILQIVFRAKSEAAGDACVFDRKKDHAEARKIARECMVLLKNDGILPLKKSGKIAVLGAFAKAPRFQGGGSSHINCAEIDEPLAEIRKKSGRLEVTYCAGYRSEEKDESELIGNVKTEYDQPDEKLIAEAKKAAAAADVAVIFAGLPDSYESEGYDRKHMRMPESQIKLIEEVAAVQKNTVVVLNNGSPVEMPWIGCVRAVLEGYLCGEASGGAAADLLFGDANPSGKLAETFPLRLADNPSYLNFPGDHDKVEYKEDIFVGYRYYDKKEIKPLFPFGFGLSYTTFEYTGIKLDRKEMSEDDRLTVTVSVKNTGKVAGKEIVELYVADGKGEIIRPVKELKGFAKVMLQPGEEKNVAITLDRRAFAYYDTDLHDFAVQSGKFTIYAGSSSDSTPLSAEIQVQAEEKSYVFIPDSTFGDVLSHGKKDLLLSELGKAHLIAEKDFEKKGPFILDAPLRSLTMFSGADYEQVAALCDKLNAG